MNYKDLHFTYKLTFYMYRYADNNLMDNAFYHRLWSDYIKSLREHFIGTIIQYEGKTVKIFQVDSYNGDLCFRGRDSSDGLHEIYIYEL